MEETDLAEVGMESAPTEQANNAAECRIAAKQSTVKTETSLPRGFWAA
jgi:hypothetical protein